MLGRTISQFIASAARSANSTTRRFRTGNTPGKPRQTGHTCTFTGTPTAVEHPQNTFVRVFSSAWTSSPILGS